MMKFLRRPAGGAAGAGGAAPAPRPPPRPPRVITSHNVNGIGARAKTDAGALSAFLREHRPDVHCVQECKLQSKPVGSSHFDQGKMWDGYRLRKTVKSVADTFQSVRAMLHRPEFRDYHVVWSLSRDPRQRAYAGTAVFYRKDLHDRPIVTRYLKEGDDDRQHEWNDEHGRVLLLEFETLFVLNTYAPNNQCHPDGWARRRAWDAKIMEWVTELKGKSGKPLVWVGDLNATTDDWDMDDPKFYRKDVYRMSPRWVDPTEDSTLDDGDKGQPGTTVNEQRRFKEILRMGGLVDAYRLKHPPPPDALLEWSAEAAKGSGSTHGVPAGDARRRRQGDCVEAGREAFTWRGSPGKDTPAGGRYFGRGMRIDYTLISESLVPRVVRAEILGRGFNRTGFLGSDHCPILLELSDATEAGGAGSGSESEIRGKKREAPLSTDLGSASSETKRAKTSCDGQEGSTESFSASDV